jgi:predicted nucleic acid-binding protein
LALVLDTGPILAALDAGDTHHDACVKLFRLPSVRRVVVAPVLVELDHLLTRQIGGDAFPALLDTVHRGELDVLPLNEQDYARSAELMRTYADLRVGFVDAAVLAVVERLREPKLATLDHRHFSVMRPRHVEALELLPA